MLKSARYVFLRRTGPKYKPIILVTGCASGIGWALAKALYRIEKYRVVITAREKHMTELKKEFIPSDRFMILPLDVTREDDRALVVQTIEAEWGGVDILVNNAGISYRSVVEHMTEEDETIQMKVNYFGPMGLIRLVLPKMREKGRGKIITVSSVSGMLAMPTMASYSASKHAIEGASEALWYEAKIMGINVSLIQPGFIKSNSFRNIYYPKGLDPAKYDGPYHDLYKNMGPFVEKMMSMSVSHPGKIANVVIKTIEKENPPLWIPATPDAILFYYIRRLLPRKWLLPVLFWGLPNSKIWGVGYSNKRNS
jgi:hypothetical protein